MVYFTRVLVLVFTFGLVIPASQPQTTCNVSHINGEALSPGDNLQIFCQTSRGVSTVWTGSLLNQQCPGNEISLAHNRFPGIRSVCGDAVGEGLSVVNHSVYSAQLSVNITCGFNNTFVTCQLDDGMITNVCNYHIRIREASSLDNVRITNISPDDLTFSWSHNTPLTSSAIPYKINSSGCGTCPTATTSTTATCSDVTFSSLQSCIFRVQTSICSSSRSATFNATFRDLISVPVLNPIISTYSQQLYLVSIHVEFQAMDSQVISPEVNITNTSYNLTYTKVTSGELCRQKTVDPLQCFNQVCQDTFDVMSPCLSADIVVTLSALNVLGITTTSIPLHIEGTNTFVMVTYNIGLKSLSCIFLKKEDMSIKQCFVTYGPCELNETKNSTGTFNTSNFSTVEVQLSLDQDRNRYCYTATASNDTYSVVVDGNFTLNRTDPNTGLNQGEISAITVTVVVVLLVIISIIIITIAVVYCKGKTSPKTVNLNDTATTSDLSHSNERTQNLTELQSVTVDLYLDPESEDNYRLYEVEENISLLHFFKNNIPAIPFIRSIAYYEFTNPTEDIKKNCKVILMDKETRKYFSGPKAHSIACASVKKEISDTLFEVNRPSNEKYRVFIRDDGTGSRHLAKGSGLLVHMDIKSGSGSNTPRSLGLTVVPTGHFKKLEVKQECQLYSLIKNEYKLDYWRGCAFYEFSHDTEDVSDDKEVLLFDVNNDKLYTGEKAKSIIGVPGVGIRNTQDRNIWRVFVQSNCTGNRHLDGGTELYYQLFDDKSKTPCTYKRGDKTHKKNESVDNYLGPDTSGELKLLQVKEICSLSNFIMRHPETSGYERKCAYYEFLHDKEDIRGKEIILMDTKGTLHVGGGAYMKIFSENNSNIDVKKPELPGYPKVFIQCTGPGNIYLTAGSSVIYKDPKIDNFEQVDVNVYHKFKVTTTCELRRFVEDKVGNFKRGAAFYQFTCEEEDISKDKEVLLLSKDGNAMYTGAAACHKIGAPGKGIPRPPDDFQYTVFVQNKSRGSRCLLEGTILFYKKNFEGDSEESVLQ